MESRFAALGPGDHALKRALRTCHEPECCPKCEADMTDNELRDESGHFVCPDCGTRLGQINEDREDR